MWKFYALSWKEKSLQKFTNVSIGFDEQIEYYLKKNREIKSFSRAKSFVKRINFPSFEFQEEMEDLLDDFIFDFQKKKKFPSTVGIRIKKYIKGHYKQVSKSKK